MVQQQTSEAKYQQNQPAMNPGQPTLLLMLMLLHTHLQHETSENRNNQHSFSVRTQDWCHQGSVHPKMKIWSKSRLLFLIYGLELCPENYCCRNYDLQWYNLCNIIGQVDLWPLGYKMQYVNNCLCGGGSSLVSSDLWNFELFIKVSFSCCTRLLLGIHGT